MNSLFKIHGNSSKGLKGIWLFLFLMKPIYRHVCNLYIDSYPSSYMNVSFSSHFLDKFSVSFIILWKEKKVPWFRDQKN
ncbi:hypothetical protein BpHYR1_046957 [Brachionus plicatilis]|uniref:Uncharacterized protein n=1 Tax=Brachionus plicatilis TaxID=10195 RepID=A0A3M7P6Z1_BRAPC|nr:hypothetical protein BpHYR1_046957 [Brachionus plicatilis]